VSQSGRQEAWRWHATAPSARPTIIVSDLGAEAVKERERKIAEGATIEPFGFSRAIPEEVRHPEKEPLTWDGDDA
jgi:hypothetical protein